MQINYRQYPHPVLSYFADDVIDSDFQASIKSSKTQNTYIFEAQCITSSNGISQLIEEKRPASHFILSARQHGIVKYLNRLTPFLPFSRLPIQ
ncbi:hypothetical protein LJK88_43980 [Paenibacillus sp. P26]|nr:hypothetical protein LJK88_43980 [Paenibacillus sp. P26]UUZ92341.1 hypothetical protein LJK87_44335 [Paenibacillus sp. P25]